MRNSLLLLIFLSFNSFVALAQHEADNWYFGVRAGLSFKNDTVVFIQGGQTGIRDGLTEGCAVISDKMTGDLQFYTDGETVWNHKHEVMKNGTGLLSGTSSCQGVVIVPNPGNDKLFYIFTAPDLTPFNNSIKTTKLHYSVASLENPDGEVIQKNIPLIDSVPEKVTATLDCSGTGFWVVTCHRRKSEVYSFHVTATGVNPIPVISDYGSDAGEYGIFNTRSFSGYIKISPDRTKLALATPSTTSPTVILFNFNPKTGMAWGYNPLSLGTNIRDCLGVAFSPDNTKLYVTGSTSNESLGQSFLFQFDVSLQTPAEIRNSLMTTQRNIGIGVIQLGPDGRIYIVNQFGALDIIEEPNKKSPAFNYKAYAVNFLPKADAQQGLPNFMDYLFNKPLPGPNPIAWCMPPPPPPPHAQSFSDSGCIGSTLKFTDLSTLKPTKREWKFENGTPATSTDSIVYVTFNQSGSNRVWLKVSNVNGTDSTLLYAEIFPNPKAEAGTDKVVCLGESTELGAPSEAGNTYLWRPTINLDNATKSNPTVTPTAKGTTKYILTVTSSHGCIARDTVLVSAGSISVNVSNDTAMCIGSSAQLLASGGSDYEWSPITGLDNPNIPNPIATPSVTTTYKVRVSSGSTCEDFDSITVTVNPYPTANAGADQTPCRGEKLQLGATPQVGYTYQWQPPTGLDDPTKSNPNATPTVTTVYVLTVTNSTGCSTKDTVLVTVGNIKAIVSNDTVVCSGTSVRLSASGGTTYKWSPIEGLDNPNSANPLCTVSSKTEYKVVISSGFCVDSAYVTVDIAQPPLANAGPDQSTCKGDPTQLGVLPQDGNIYTWQPPTGLDNPTISNPIATVIETTQYILTVTNSTGCTSQDTVIVTMNPRNEYSFTLSPSIVTIIPGQQFQTVLNVPSGVPIWKVHLDYDDLIVKFGAIAQMSNGISATAVEKKGILSVNGTGENGQILMTFNSFLPYTTDTTFAMNLTVDSASIQPCETVLSNGNTLELGVFCGRRIRTVSSTGKNYFLTNKENGVNFGVGLSGNVRLELYDYTGTLKEILADGNMEAGEYSIDFDLPTGVYFCRVNSGMYNDVQKVIILN